MSEQKRKSLPNRLFKSAQKLVGMAEGSKYNPKRAQVLDDDEEDGDDDDLMDENHDNSSQSIDILHLSKVNDDLSQEAANQLLEINAKDIEANISV